jgi:hypothetical protein
MKIELLVVVITGFFVANTYNDGKYMEKIKSLKKYYQMIGIAFAGLSAYLFLKKYPGETSSLLNSASGVIRYLPVDKDAGDILSPIIDFTKSSFVPSMNNSTLHSNKVLQSGNNNNSKRSVSETKKKYVAAQQGWSCGVCRKQLPAWFEVDHKIRLDNGGSNHIDNLIALCRDCHGKKTALENL